MLEIKIHDEDRIAKFKTIYFKQIVQIWNKSIYALYYLENTPRNTEKEKRDSLSVGEKVDMELMDCLLDSGRTHQLTISKNPDIEKVFLKK